jgi:hypothetical protein
LYSPVRASISAKLPPMQKPIAPIRSASTSGRSASQRRAVSRSCSSGPSPRIIVRMVRATHNARGDERANRSGMSTT